MENELAADVRRLRREVAATTTYLEERRQVTVGLVVALVGLVLGMCLPWVVQHEPIVTEGRWTEGGVTGWVDGWLLLGQGVTDPEMWPFAVATSGTLVLAVLVARLLQRLDAGPVTAVRAVAWIGVVGLSLTWLVLVLGDWTAGAGVVVAAASCLVAALSAHRIASFAPRVLVAAPTPAAVSLLESGPIRASAAPEEPTPTE